MKRTVKAAALNKNPALNRWRFVVKDEDGTTLWSSPYCYATEAEALAAGAERKEARPQPGGAA